MGLLDTYRSGGLFSPPPAYRTPGIGDGIPGNRRMDGSIVLDPETQDAVGAYAAMPKGKQGKGGLFGSGYDGEDILNMLLRAAAIAQGDYEGGAQFGANIGAKAKAAAAEAMRQQQRMEGLQDYEVKQGIEARYRAAPELPGDVRTAEWYRNASPEQRANWDNLHSQLLALQQGGAVARVKPGGVPELVVAPNPGGQAPGAPVTDTGVTPFHDPQTGQTYYRVGNRVFDNEAEARAAGGGVSNGPGNFRTP